MSAVASPLPIPCTPSDAEAGGLLDKTRRTVERFSLTGTLTAATFFRHYFRVPGRIVRVESFRRTAASGVGAGGSTDVDVNLNGTSVLAATKMEHENSDGNGTHVVGTLDTAHAAYDSTYLGIEVAIGDYLEVAVDAIEAGATGAVGLDVQVEYVVG